MKYIFPFLASFIFLFSCQPKPIDIDVPPAEERLVIASQVLPNSIMVIGLTRSFSPLDPAGHEDTLQNDFLDRILVPDGIVTVTHPSGTDTLYMVTPGIYASINVLLVDYGTYTIHAKDPATGLEVTATTELLPGVSFDSIQPYKQVVEGDTVPFIHYELSDYGAASDYYVVCYYRKSQDTSAFDLNNYFSQGSNELNAFDLITDQDFDEQGKLSRNNQLYDVSNTDTIAVTVSHITKGYYEFLSAYKRSSSLFNQLSGEPINYPTNVEGGYGYFNTHFPEVRIFELINY
ncbi:MAG: DUF4249 domain-containing protein [Bacteroidota bacterium]|nr:DUF4249 domain-containing protein [Bacteroidota bacterium]